MWLQTCRRSNGSEKTAWWNQEVKKAICAKKTVFRAWLTERSSGSFNCSTPQHIRLLPPLSNSLKKVMGRIWTKVGYRLEVAKVFWQTIHRLHSKQTPVAAFIKETNGVLLKHQKGILNCWREYFCELLNPVTVQYLETSQKQFSQEIHLTKAELRTAIKSLEAGKALGKDDI